MTAPRVDVELGERSAWFGGDAGLVAAAVRTVGCPRQYDRRRRAVSVPRKYADDVEAALELQFGAEIRRVEAIA